MVQFNPPPPPSPVFMEDLDVALNIVLKELKLSNKQSDERGYFVQYFTTSTKKPYVWERYDAFTSVKPNEYPEYFKHAQQELEKQKNTYEWQGIKLVAFAFDSLQPLNGVKILKEYCFETITPKVKTYINGTKANQEFLAKKGKMFTTKASV